MAPTRIERWDVPLDGPLSEAALRRKIEALGFEVSARTHPAAVAAIAPPAPRDALTAVVRGLVKLTVEGEQSLLTAGDLAFVAAGAAWRIETIGPAPALCFEAIRREG